MRSGLALAHLGLAAMLALDLVPPAGAQGVQTGELTGIVRSADGQPLPGVTVSIKSSALQGVRTATTDSNGGYIFKGLPPGSYAATFNLSGFGTVERAISVALGGAAKVDASLAVAAVQETVTVTAETPSVLSTSQVGANYTGKTVDSLATGRRIDQIAELAPGVQGSTNAVPNTAQVSISGSFAYETQFLVNGVDVADNVFGNAVDLYIEDAIQETQVLTSGISAEYGRFGGGVVNAITKRGGNDFSGSIRANLSSPSWTAQTPFEESQGIDRKHDVQKIYEATLGGPVVKDRLWFFLAGRKQDTNQQLTFDETGIPYDRPFDAKRWEAKLTGNINPNHTLQASYTRQSVDVVTPSFDFSIDPATIVSSPEKDSLFVANYNGVLRSNLFAEAQYSQKKEQLTTGGTDTNIFASPMLTVGNLAPPGLQYNSPYFDGTDPEDRDNRQITAALSYFLSTKSLGRHDIKGGFEHFSNIRTGGNSQSPTNYVFYADYQTDPEGKPALDGSGRLTPIFVPGESQISHYLAERGAELKIKTLSLYLNDKWTLGNRWSFNLGVRYEKVRSDATGGILGIDTDTVVPRLAASFDVKGDGRFRLDATYAHYAGKYIETQVGSTTPVGNPAGIYGIYTGPAGQGRDFAPGFDPANYVTFTGRFPTANIFLDSGLSSPTHDEWTAAAGTSFSHGGYAKVIYTHRRIKEFIEDFIDTGTGTTTVVQDGVNFGTFSNKDYRNTNIPRRRYDALQVQAGRRLGSRWDLTGHYTLQLKNDGNTEGESANQPGAPTVIGDYPEVYAPDRDFPYGHLRGFQRHKVRLWTTYELKLGRLGDMNIGALYRYDSPLYYSLAAGNVPFSDVQLSHDPGYVDLPTSQTLFFGSRRSQAFAGSHIFDVALTYSIPVVKSLKPYVKIDVRNAFNNDTLTTWNTTIVPNPNSPLDASGLPTGYIKGSRFGQATSAGNFPLPRTLLIAAGFRF